jgi:TRAP-type mannitol/chloroaromatic compound transport system permease small subunit
VDIFYGKLSPQRKAWVDLIGTLLFLLPFCIFTIWVSLPYVSASWRLLEGSREAGGLPLVFLLKTFIPLMAALLLLQGLSTIGRSLKEIR